MNSTATIAAPAERSITSALRRGLCAFLPFTLAFSANAASEPSLITGEKKSFAYSWEQERQLGAETDREIVAQVGLYDDPQLQSYVQAVGDRVAGHSEFASPNAPEIYRDTNLTFRVIDSPVVNAFAVPGGYIYVTRGLLSHLQNEAQLAVVLGHEIAHVAARHSSVQARRAQWGQLGAIAGAILGQKVLGDAAPNIAPAILEAGGKALELFMLRYSREAEQESDELGVRYATHAGYAAAESARFFHALKHISTDEGKALPAWQSTHPDPGDRARRVVQLAVNTSTDGRATNVGEGEYLRHIEGIVLGEDPRGGFVESGVFYHPALRFQLPVAEGWKIDNQRTSLIMAEPNGKAMIGLRLAPGSRARDAAMQFSQQNKIQVTASGDTTVNGLPASVIVGNMPTEKGEVGVWNAFLEMDGRVYSILGYATSRDFEQMRSTFENVAAGFSPLPLPAHFEVQPTRLKLARADRGAPFASFVPTSLPQELSAEAVAHMNQMALNDQVNEGRTLKLPDAKPRPVMAQIVQEAAARQAPTHPSQSGHPSQYPPSGYPPQATYPPQPPNQPPASSYPSQTQPPQTYPPQTYPPQSRTDPYPRQEYPQQTYPQSGYPQQPQQTPQYPASNYPPQQGQPQPSANPQQQRYPQQTYPQQTYPQQTYPQQTYPQQTQPSRPQWPQPGTTTQQQQQQPPSQQPSQQPSPPVWPR